MNLLFLGGGATAGAIAGVTGATKIAVVGAIAAAADPEPISKTILASATAVLAVTAAGTALLLVKRLYDGQLKPKSFECGGNPPRFKMEFYP